MKSDYDSHLSRFKIEPTDLVYQGLVFRRPAAKMPTTIEPDDEGVSGRVLSFVVEFADSLQQVAEQAKRWIVSQLIDLLTKMSFKMNTFKRYIKSFCRYQRCSH